MQQSKILVTLGPSTSTPEQIRCLFEAGANAVRINFSHGTHAEHAERIKIVRSVTEQLGYETAVLGDLCGPKLRVGCFANRCVTLKQGDRFTLTTRDVQGDETQVTMSYPLHEDLSFGDRLLLDDGLMTLQVVQVLADGLVCRVIVGGVLSDHKGVNVPGVRLSVPAITEKDEQDIRFGRDVGVDWFALSFVRDAVEVARCKALAGDIPVIAKLEKPEAVEHLKAIIAVADGVMVARGDLGVEMGSEYVPVAQKQIIQWANHQGKLVITATQMLDSMMHNPRPTRAEASDVANAIFDGSDVVMLSGETAAGKYPVEAVAMMRAIAEQVESSELYRERPSPTVYTDAWASENATARAAATLSRDVKLKAVVVAACGPEWVDVLADYRPQAPILALVNDVKLARRLALQWGMLARVVPLPASQEALIAIAEANAVALLGAQPGDDIAILSPCLPQQSGQTLTLWKVSHGL
jgi:pyruvate kinase